MRAAGIVFAALLLAGLVWVSRFQPFPELGGGLWRDWMWRLGLGDYDLLLWAVAAFGLLTLAERLWARLSRHD